MIESCTLAARATDEEIRYRCRNAPPEIRKRIDRARDAAGRPTLWSPPSRLVAAHKRALAAIKKNAAFLERMRAK